MMNPVQQVAMGLSHPNCWLCWEEVSVQRVTEWFGRVLSRGSLWLLQCGEWIMMRQTCVWRDYISARSLPGDRLKGSFRCCYFCLLGCCIPSCCKQRPWREIRLGVSFHWLEKCLLLSMPTAEVSRDKVRAHKRWLCLELLKHNQSIYSLSLSLYIHIHMYTHIYTHIGMYIYIDIYIHVYIHVLYNYQTANYH